MQNTWTYTLNGFSRVWRRDFPRNSCWRSWVGWLVLFLNLWKRAGPRILAMACKNVYRSQSRSQSQVPTYPDRRLRRVALDAISSNELGMTLRLGEVLNLLKHHCMHFVHERTLGISCIVLWSSNFFFVFQLFCSSPWPRFREKRKKSNRGEDKTAIQYPDIDSPLSYTIQSINQTLKKYSQPSATILDPSTTTSIVVSYPPMP